MILYGYANEMEPSPDADRLSHIAEQYEASDRFDADALEWLHDHPEPADLWLARQRYAASPKFADVVNDIADGEVTL